MPSIFEFNEDRKKDSLVVLVTREQDCREFIQVPHPRDLVMAEFDFCTDDQASPRVPAPDDGRLIVASPRLGFLSQFDPLLCDLKGHCSELCP